MVCSEGGPAVRNQRKGLQGRRGIQHELQLPVLVPERPVRMLHALPSRDPAAVHVQLSRSPSRCISAVSISATAVMPNGFLKYLTDSRHIGTLDYLSAGEAIYLCFVSAVRGSVKHCEVCRWCCGMPYVYQLVTQMEDLSRNVETFILQT